MYTNVVRRTLARVVAMRLLPVDRTPATSAANPTNTGVPPLSPEEHRLLASRQYGVDCFRHARQDGEHMLPEDRAAVDYSVSTIEQIRVLLEGRHVHFAIAMYPHQQQMVLEADSTWNLTSYPRLWNRSYEKSIAALAEAHHVPFHSFYDEFAADLKGGAHLYLPNDMHFNPEGMARFGQHLAAWVVGEPVDTLGIALKP